jgi:glyoxylase-like metal-dependent hydrolase (beta-lactamase superfamily II)/rhodanese-related sulfurtransferase
MSAPHGIASEVPGVEVPELLARLDRGDDVVILDVRNDEEWKDWKLEARRPVTAVHVPYFDFIEDPATAMAKVPRGRDVVALCAQGGSSAMIVQMLQEQGIPARNVKGGMIAYGEHLQPVPVPLRADEQGRFELWQLNRRGKGCLSYVVLSGAEAVVVDPSRHVERYLEFVQARGARIVQVLETHIQADHVSGGPALAARTGAPYFASAGAGFDAKLPITPLREGEVLRLDGGVTVEVRLLATPGHTPGSTSYLVGDRYLLAGDTLFVSSVGRPDLGGHVVEWGKALFHTLHGTIAALPDETLVLPAHYAGVAEIGPDGVVAGRLGALRHRVPELSIPSPDAFVEAVRAAITKPPDSYAEIIRVNLGHAAPAEEKITEWELGKNQCAVSAVR